MDKSATLLNPTAKMVLASIGIGIFSMLILSQPALYNSYRNWLPASPAMLWDALPQIIAVILFCRLFGRNTRDRIKLFVTGIICSSLTLLMIMAVDLVMTLKKL